MSEIEVEECLKCDVCKDTFYDPITLLCQHTFCSFCLSSLKECPMCRLKLHLPKQRNQLMTDLIEVLYGPEKLKELTNKFHLTKLEKEIRPQVEKDLRTNFDKMLLENTKTNKPKDSEEVKNVNVDTSVPSNTVPAAPIPQTDNESDSSFWSIDNMIKFVEFAFLAYYFYVFVTSFTNYGFSWIKLLLNLFVLLQAFLPMVSSNYFALPESSSNVLANFF